MPADAALLRRYAAEGSQDAFAELVRRHLGLVYHAALRQTGGDPHRAEEIAQLVFTNVARQADALARHPLLVAWLHTTTRHAASQLRRARSRRRLGPPRAPATPRTASAPSLSPPGPSSTPPAAARRADALTPNEAIKAYQQRHYAGEAALAWARNAPAAALALYAQVRDPALRVELITARARDWLATDRPAATAWLEKSSALTPEQAAELLQAK